MKTHNQIDNNENYQMPEKIRYICISQFSPMTQRLFHGWFRAKKAPRLPEITGKDLRNNKQW